MYINKKIDYALHTIGLFFNNRVDYKFKPCKLTFVGQNYKSISPLKFGNGKD